MTTTRTRNGELKQLKAALEAAGVTTGASKTHLHFVLAGDRQPSLALAQALDAAGYPVWALYPELPRPEAPSLAPKEDTHGQP